MQSAIRFIPALFVLLWASGYIGARYAMLWSEPWGFLAVRFTLSAILLLLLVLILRSARLRPAQAAHATLAGALIHGLYLSCGMWAIKNGMHPALVALIVNLQPLITALLAGWTLGEKVQPRHWAGLAVGFLGIVVVLAPKIGATLGGVTVTTVGVCLVGAFTISVGMVWQKKFVGSGDLVTATLWQYVGASAVTAALALAFETGTYTLNGELIFAMIWLVLVVSIGAVFLLMVMIRRGEMSKVSSLFYLVPAVTAILAWALSGETLTPVQILGMAITTAGVAMATRR